MKSKLSIWLVEDNATYRESIGRLLKRADPDWEISFFPNCEAAFQALAAGDPPQVMLLDIHLPGISGADGVLRFRQLAPGMQVVMLTSSDNQKHIQSVIRHGASGYLLKTGAPERIIDAIRDVMTGGSPLTPQVASTLLNQMRERNSLTPAATRYRD
jgi:DNA-binding NarL/FixJ family response regulator